MYAVADDEFTAEENANVLVNQCMPFWSYPTSILSDSGLQRCSKLSVAILKRLRVRKVITSVYHVEGNRSLERVDTRWLKCLPWS